MDRLDVLICMAIQEDLGHGDVTTHAVIDSDMAGKAFVMGREPFVLSGSRPFQRVFQLLDPAIEIEGFFQDGEQIQTGIPVFKLTGRVETLLVGERTGLNLLQRLCGIASLTRQMVEALSGTNCRLLDTRKTTPPVRVGWRGGIVRSVNCLPADQGALPMKVWAKYVWEWGRWVCVECHSAHVMFTEIYDHLHEAHGVDPRKALTTISEREVTDGEGI